MNENAISSDERKINMAVTENTDLLNIVRGSNQLAMELMFNERLYERCRNIARSMAAANGITPQHLIGKPEACYAVVTRSILWKLDPFAVAGSTYIVSGKIGYEGKLCRAILENSGRFEERLKYEPLGDWTKVQGKMKKANGKNGSYWTPDWDIADEEGLGVRITAKLIGEKKPIVFDFYLKQAQTRNSTLWATDPLTQLKYLTTRRFANSEVPDIFMGVPFDKEDFDTPNVRDITPSNGSNSNDINDFIKAQADSDKEVEKAAHEPDAAGDGDKDATNEAGFKSPSEAKAEEIIEALTSAANPDEARDIYDSMKHHIDLLQDDLQETIANVFDEISE